MDGISNTHSREQAGAVPYGQACTNCARAKCRCVQRGNGNVCERCLRLGKDCQASVSVRKRSTKKPTKSKTQKLEDRVDGLAHLLNVSLDATELQPHQTAIPTGSNEENRDTQDASVVVDMATGFPKFTPDTTLNPFLHSVGSSQFSLETYLGLHEIPDRKAEEQLEVFRRTFQPFYTFVHIPASLCAQELRSQKPFLWLAIMSLTTKKRSLQLALGETLRRIVSEQIVMRHQKNLDLLLGLLCHLAWCHLHKMENSSMTVWTQLAVALIFELGIHEEPTPRARQLSSKRKRVHQQQPKSQVRTLEERRGVLGTFVISSMMWVVFRKMEPLRWTCYMDDCVRILSQENETELDALLIAKAKCYIVANQITQSQSEQMSHNAAFNASSIYLVKAMQLQLQNTRKSLSDPLQSNRAALLSIFGTELRVQDALLADFPYHGHKGTPQLHRLEILESILATIEQWFKVYHAVPLVEWIAMTFDIHVQFSHCIILLFKLSTLDEPGWDTNSLKERIYLPDLMERSAQRLDEISRAYTSMEHDAGATIDNTLFPKASRLVRGMKALFLQEIAPKTAQMDTELLENVPPEDEVDENPIPDDFMMDLANDPWLSDIYLTFLYH